MTAGDEFTELLKLARCAALREGLTNEDAEDVASIAITAYWQSRGVIRNPVAWIRLVAKRHAWKLRLHNSMKRDVESRDRATLLMLHDDSSCSLDEWLDLRAALLNLRQLERQAVFRRDVEGASLESIADSTGLSSSTVKRRLRRGRESLRLALSGRLADRSWGRHDNSPEESHARL